MTKALLQIIVIVGAMAGFWISLSTKLDTNSAASAKLIAYKESEDQSNQKLLLEVLRLTGNDLELTKSVEQMGKQTQTIAEQMNKVLNEHTKTFEQIKTGAKQAQAEAAAAKVAAQKDQVQTRQAIKAITKPKPNWFQGLFTTPTPWRHR